LGALVGAVGARSQVAHSRQPSNSRQTRKRYRLLALQKAGENAGLAVAQAHALLHGFVGEHRNRVHALSRERAQLDTQFHRDVAVRVDPRSGLDLRAQVNVFRARERRQPGSCRGLAGGRRRRIEYHRNRVCTFISYRHVRQAVPVKIRRGDTRGRRSDAEVQRQTELPGGRVDQQRNRRVALVHHHHVRESVLIDIADDQRYRAVPRWESARR
jgi:hypothetical protein